MFLLPLLFSLLFLYPFFIYPFYLPFFTSNFRTRNTRLLNCIVISRNLSLKSISLSRPSSFIFIYININSTKTFTLCTPSVSFFFFYTFPASEHGSWFDLAGFILPLLFSYFYLSTQMACTNPVLCLLSHVALFSMNCVSISQYDRRHSLTSTIIFSLSFFFRFVCFHPFLLVTHLQIRLISHLHFCRFHCAVEEKMLFIIGLTSRWILPYAFTSHIFLFPSVPVFHISTLRKLQLYILNRAFAVVRREKSHFSCQNWNSSLWSNSNPPGIEVLLFIFQTSTFPVQSFTYFSLFLLEL